MKKSIILQFFIIINFALYSQSPRINRYNSNAWLMYFGDHKISSKFGIHLESQLRLNDYIKNNQQLLLRTGLNYHITNNIFTTVGYCYVKTYPYGAFPVKSIFPENRIWEQIQFKNQYGKIEIINRFRLEQRFSKLPVLINLNEYEPGDAVYTNRFRMLNRISIPFKGNSIKDKSFYFSCYNEFMINFGKHVGVNLLDQNRAYAAIGYKIPNIGRLEIGFLEQTIIKSDGLKIENNHTIQIGLSSTIDFYKKSKL